MPLTDWIAVLDGDPVSDRQRDVCKTHCKELKGWVDCRTQDVEEKICFAVKQFPAFCNVQTDECTYGLRDTPEAIAALNQ